MFQYCRLQHQVKKDIPMQRSPKLFFFAFVSPQTVFLWICIPSNCISLNFYPLKLYLFGFLSPQTVFLWIFIKLDLFQRWPSFVDINPPSKSF